MNHKKIFVIIGVIHIVVAICLVVFAFNFDELIKPYVSTELTEEVKTLNLAQIRAAIVHSFGLGLIMYCCRSLSNASERKNVLAAYSIFAILLLGNAIYAECCSTGGPPLPIFALIAVSTVLGVYGYVKGEA